MKRVTWRVGKHMPINVYEGDRPICQCHTALDAKRIVAGVNGTSSILREVLPQLRWANIHGSRCDELIAEIEAVIEPSAEGKVSREDWTPDKSSSGQTSVAISGRARESK